MWIDHITSTKYCQYFLLFYYINLTNFFNCIYCPLSTNPPDICSICYHLFRSVTHHFCFAEYFRSCISWSDKWIILTSLDSLPLYKIIKESIVISIDIFAFLKFVSIYVHKKDFLISVKLESQFRLKSNNKHLVIFFFNEKQKKMGFFCHRLSYLIFRLNSTNSKLKIIPRSNFFLRID